jgi:hypothetical protein
MNEFCLKLDIPSFNGDMSFEVFINIFREKCIKKILIIINQREIRK